MDYTYAMNKEANCKRVFNIEIPKEKVAAKFDEVFRMLKKEAKVPGFRPGKVPMSVIKSRFGKEARADVGEQLIQDAFQEVIKDAKIDPISLPVLSEVDYRDDEPIKFTASIEVAPEIKLEKTSGFTFTKKSEVITDDNVEEAYKAILYMQSSIEVSEDPAKEGDFVTVDMKKISDPENRLKKDEFKDFVIELSRDAALPAFVDNLVGVRAGDEKDITVEYPADYPEKSLSNAKLGYSIKVTAVKTKVAPEFNDEFFEKFGEDVKSVDELKAKIRLDLETRRRREIQEGLRDQAIKSTITHNQFELPQSLIENYLDDIVADFHERHKEDDFDEAEVRDNYRALAIRMIRWDLLMHEIAKQEGIKAETQDVDKWIEGFADSYNMNMEEAKAALEKSGKVREVRETVLEAKVMSHILDGSEIVEE